MADGSNSGRRLIWGNIASDVTATAVPEHPVKRCMTSLPRELTLAADAKSVRVTAPPELAELCASPMDGSRAAAAGDSRGAQDHELRCGDRVMQGQGDAMEIELRLNISAAVANVPLAETAPATFEVGAFLLATDELSEALRVYNSPRTLAGAAFNGSNVAIDLRSTNNDTAKGIANTMSVGDWPWHSVILAPFAAPASGVVQLRIFLDVNMLEVFAADCACPAAASVSSLAACDCSQNEQAVALTALAAPSTTAGAWANRLSLFAHCAAGEPGLVFPASSRCWRLRAANFTQQQPVKTDDSAALATPSASSSSCWPLSCQQCCRHNKGACCDGWHDVATALTVNGKACHS